MKESILVGLDRWLGRVVALSFPGAAAGYASSWLAWQFVYSIGSCVVSDEVHYAYAGSVAWCGAAAGACSGFALALLPKLWPGASFKCLAALHAVSVLDGAVAVDGSDWRGGLIGYFGTHAVAASGCVLFSVTPSARRGQSHHASDKDSGVAPSKL